VGDGIVMAEAVGDATRDMQFITTVLMDYHTGCTLAEAGKILGTQQLVVNAQGVRFADESKNSGVQKAMNDQSDGLGYLIGDSKMSDSLSAVSDGFVEDLVGRGWVYRADTLEEAAALAGLDAGTVAETPVPHSSRARIKAAVPPDVPEGAVMAGDPAGRRERKTPRVSLQGRIGTRYAVSRRMSAGCCVGAGKASLRGIL